MPSSRDIVGNSSDQNLWIGVRSKIQMSVTLQNLVNAWPALLGYPALVAALVLTFFAVRRKKAFAAFAAAILIAPLSFYILGSPVFWWLGVLVPATLLGIGIAIAIGNRRASET